MADLSPSILDGAHLGLPLKACAIRRCGYGRCGAVHAPLFDLAWRSCSIDIEFLLTLA